MAAHAMPRLGRGAALRDRRQRPSSCSGAFPFTAKIVPAGVGQTVGARARVRSSRHGSRGQACPVALETPLERWGQHVHRRRGPSGCTR